MLPLVGFEFDSATLETVRRDAPPVLMVNIARLGADLDLLDSAFQNGLRDGFGDGFGAREDVVMYDAGARADEPPQREEWLPLAASAWRSDTFDLLAFDDEVWRRAGQAGRCRIRLGRGGGHARPALNGRQILGTMRQVVTRYQRFLRWRNPASSTPLFARVLGLHDRLHDRSKALIAADHDHALDTWRWTLRLAPDASFAVQVAALFHDVERLYVESEVRIEHRAPDYQAFKAAHAAAGSRIVADLMARADVPPVESRRVCELVARHELGGEHGLEGGGDLDQDRALLNEADALSFFSLNASGFLKHFGPEHTARKVSYTLRRLGPDGRRELSRIKLSAPIRGMLESAEP
jgi:hypothetical protein